MSWFNKNEYESVVPITFTWVSEIDGVEYVSTQAVGSVVTKNLLELLDAMRVIQAEVKP